MCKKLKGGMDPNIIDLILAQRVANPSGNLNLEQDVLSLINDSMKKELIDEKNKIII